MKISPLVIQSGLYQGGQYFNTQNLDSVLQRTQFVTDRSLAHGMEDGFLFAFSALSALPEMTVISDDSESTFLMMNNGTTHDVVLLKEPEYEPEMYIDNAIYDAAHEDRFTIEGRTLLTDAPYRMRSYHSNMAAFLQLGKWFDMMREQDVYDNTRIILASDHGFSLEQFEDMIFGGKRDEEKIGHQPEDIMAYNPLLMMKDFDSKGFQIDNQFMTNADTPTLALSGLLNSPVNPFSGKAINDSAKDVDAHHVFFTEYSATYPRNTFYPGHWYELQGQNIFDLSAWHTLGYY